MANTYRIIDFDLIDEGRFIERAREVFRKVQHDLIDHHEKYHGECTNGKATVVLHVTAGWEIPKKMNEAIFTVRSELKCKSPLPPAVVNLAIPSDTEDGRMALFVKPSGASYDSPKQERFLTADGRRVDAGSGEVIEAEAVQ